MTMKVQSYLAFEGRTQEALDFYQSALGAVVEKVLRYKDMPGACPPGSGMDEKILHCSFLVGETQVMASDGRMSGDKAEFKGIWLALTVDDDADAKKRFAALQAGGQVIQPLMPAFFTTAFGIVADKFGVTWMIVSATVPKAA
jgi:PhnB protein